MRLDWLFTTHLAVRRLIAVIAVLGYPLCWAALGLDGLVPPALRWSAIAVTTISWVLAITLVYGFRRRLAQAPDTDLDEREAGLRNESYLIAYRILNGVVLAGGLAAVVGLQLADLEIVLRADDVMWILTSLLVASVTLPSAVVAWRDTETDDETVGHAAEFA